MPEFTQAYLLQSDTLPYLTEHVSVEEWEKSKKEMEWLAEFTNEFGAGCYYVLLTGDPATDTLGHVTDVRTLHIQYDAKFYNEEILTLTPKK